ncbi:20051_t:CDS:2 [Gigaspora margarita]|uniref:20051_t:CDS:1 n=1 Tax=Gigaspora margarita TaxID=4874 RepID=A0ABN7VDG4_GIGMA|nr:20051_t:CDS:2 [Gigaspora margarita]
MAKTRQEKQKIFLLNHTNPCSFNFYERFNYRNRSSARRDYDFQLNWALQEAPQSEKLLNLKRSWENNEYDSDWARYEDKKNIRRADKKVKRRKLKAHIAFNENLDERLNKLNIKKPSDKLASSSKGHVEASKKTTNRQFENQIVNIDNKENEDGSETEEVSEVKIATEGINIMLRICQDDGPSFKKKDLFSTNITEYNVEELISVEECEEIGYVINNKQIRKSIQSTNANNDELEIVDLTEFDRTYQAMTLFSQEDWNEIFSFEVKKLPNIDSSIINLMKNYSYQLNIWDLLIDFAFRNSSFNLIRVDGMSEASSDRKNQANRGTNRKKIGRKGDGIFRLKRSSLEFGAIESGRE